MNIADRTTPAEARAVNAARVAPLVSAVLALGMGGLLFWLGLRRYLGYNAGMYDLGNMAQAIGSVLRGHPLVVTFPDGPLSRLAMHVELIYLLLVPLWAIWPSPLALLLAQAALYAAGALPAYRLGARAAGEPLGGVCLSAIYLLYPVAQTAVLFDFHGDTLAMPLLLFALEALDRRAWRRYALWIALALSCKFYIAALVAGLGALLFLRPDTRRAGLLTGLAGAGYGLLAFFVIRPLFTTETTAQTHRGLSYISFYFGQIDQLVATMPQRLLVAAVVLGPALLLAWGGRRWLLPALPLAAAAIVSTGPGNSFDYRYHHYASLVPFIVMAAAEGLRRARERRPARRPWRADMLFTTLTVALVGALLVDQPLNPLFWLRAPNMGFDPSVYGLTARDALKDRFLAERVPPRAPIAASMFLGPHLVDRDTLYMTRYNDDPGGRRLPAILPRVDYVLADALFDWRSVGPAGFAGGAAYEQAEIGQVLRSPEFGLVAADDGLLLFARGASDRALAQSARVVAASPQGPATVAGPARLLRSELVPVGGRRYRATLVWSLAGPPPPGPGLVAVSRLEGPGELRIVHLPTYALMPITGWQEGQAVEEQFEFELPERLPAGGYSWQIGWYNLGHAEAYATDARSRAGEEVVGGAFVLP